MTSVYQNDHGSWVWIASFSSGIDALSFLHKSRACPREPGLTSGYELVYKSPQGVEYKTVHSHGEPK